MSKIMKLPSKLANLIAAGEVVERPASVIKELVENAIDAHATVIQVFLEDGGLRQMKVVDNGEGMDEEDLKLAFLPHATSKIRTEYDLFRISTLGFRGEAIASIAAVSTMQIISSQDGTGGYQVTYKAGVFQKEGPIHSNRGTTVIVDGLFFNTPARLKHLKSAKNELASISYLMDRLALAHPEIRFQLIHDQKKLLSTSASGKTEDLMGEIYGLEVAGNFSEEEYLSKDYRCKLILVQPSVYRSNKLEMTLIVNGRYVRNYAVYKAITEGYSTYLPIGKYPIAVIYLTIDPQRIDVNVHPAKTEIKISLEEEFCEELKNKIQEVLGRTTYIPNRKIPSLKESYLKENIFDFPQSAPEPSLKQEVPSKEEIPESDSLFSFEDPTERIPYMEYIGQAFGKYLLFQNDSGLYLLDQHAAAERINYEKYYELLGKNDQPSSELLVPLMMSFTKSEASYVEEHLSEFEKIGFTLEAISAQDFLVRRVPLWIQPEDIEQRVEEILSLLIENKKIEIIAFRDQIAKQISCKASVKANHALSSLEVSGLLEQLSHCKKPFTCPHGRPVFIHFSLTDLDKMFERIQK